MNEAGEFMSVQVYDIKSCMFRKLNVGNLDDDMECGFVLFSREIIELLKEYYFLCGYVLIDKEYRLFSPIDIQKERIVIFEGTYNCMPVSLKEKLENYNIQSCTTTNVISSFFFRWQFALDYDVFTKNGAFIELCSNILGSKDRFEALCDKGIYLYEPETFEELCYFVQNILTLTEIDINSLDCSKSYKYLIDSIKRGYHINFSDLDIQNSYIQISKLADERWKLSK